MEFELQRAEVQREAHQRYAQEGQGLNERGEIPGLPTPIIWVLVLYGGANLRANKPPANQQVFY